MNDFVIVKGANILEVLSRFKNILNIFKVSRKNGEVTKIKGINNIKVSMTDIEELDVYKEITSNKYSRQFNKLFKSMDLINSELNQYVSVENIEHKHYFNKVTFKLHGGLSISKFINKLDDIAHSLNTKSLRIENDGSHMIFKIYKDDVKSPKIQYGESDRSLILHGMDEDGNNDYINLMQDFFIRIVGAPGCGKSTKLYAMLLDIIKYDKADVYIICLKGKAPFEMFEGIPNVKCIVTDEKEGYKVLKEFYESGKARNDVYIDCNEMIKNGADIRRKIALVDECGPLTRVSDKNNPNQYLELVAKIPKELRASAHHLVLATQRPTKEEIAPIISSTMTSIIGMRASNQNESDIMMEDERLQDFRPHTGIFNSAMGRRFVRNFEITEKDVREELDKIKKERGIK